ncbi:MAG: hypothetical protein JRG79_06275 [Deltaproteobacteria bacterium]|nr:hypothetical protein [Deltaproteobacteria bacterium]
MLEKFGVISNCWAKALEKGVRFEDLIVQFAEQGFTYQEVRDAEYLRATEFGRYLDTIEEAMPRYSDESWKEICDGIRQKQGWEQLAKKEDQALFKHMADFVEITEGLVISYAAAHRWLNEPENIDEDNDRIRKAIKLAYLLSTAGMARLRLVDIEPLEGFDPEAAVSNLKRYRALLPDYPMTYALEHAHQSAPLTLDLAVRGGFSFAYDEANLYIKGGPDPGELEDFWAKVELSHLTSIHLKQIDAQGFSSSLAGEGFVDFSALMDRLEAIGYAGEFLLENVPTDQPLEDARESRAFIHALKA